MVELVDISETGELKFYIMDLPLSCILIISEGNVMMGELPPHEETCIETNDEKVKRVNFDEEEEFWIMLLIC